MSIIWAIKLIPAILMILMPLWSIALDIKPDSIVTEKKFSVSAEIIGGISYNLRDDVFKSQKMHFSPSLRLLWKPDHRLNIGIETTYMTIRKIEVEKNKNKLKGNMEAIPMLLVFNMKAFHLDFIAGIGVGYISSTIDVMKEVTTATNWHYCSLFGFGYSYMFSDYIGLGIEARLFSFTKTDEFVGSGVLKIVFNIPY